MRHPNPVIASYDRLPLIYDHRWRSCEEATLQAALDGLSCRPGQRLLELVSSSAELESLLLGKS